LINIISLKNEFSLNANIKKSQKLVARPDRFCYYFNA